MTSRQWFARRTGKEFRKRALRPQGSISFCFSENEWKMLTLKIKLYLVLKKNKKLKKQDVVVSIKQISIFSILFRKT